MLRKLWIVPPLAIGRVGSAGKPAQAYSWAHDVIAPGQHSTTRLQAEETLTLDENGVVSSQPPNAFNHIAFKDEENRFFPVCPFFELHGEWDEPSGAVQSGPVTEQVLENHGPQVDGRSCRLSDVKWSVTLANLKAHHYTLRDSDRLQAHVELAGDDTRRALLEGRTPTRIKGRAVVGEPLIPQDRFIPLGSAQLSRPSAAFPELRLRIYPPHGVVYGSEDLAERPLEGEWASFRLSGRELVNPKSAWASLNLNSIELPPLGSDSRNNPGGLAASDRNGISLGLVDDVSDGIITCEIGANLRAAARIAIGPPDFAPNARPVVSLQDGLTDREGRLAVREEDITLAELEAIVHDIFERALETSELMNKDAQSDRAHRENGEQLLPPPPPGYQDRPIGTLWPRSDSPTATDPRPDNIDALPVTFEGQRRHRRLNALEYLKDRLREEPSFIDNWLRPPVDRSRAYDRRMPPLMRNSDRYPLHLTRRQAELIKKWVAKLREGGA